ncbi:MAG: hypothetical protein ACRDVG_15850 [Jatrophihabitantaceae bacterium]
MLDPDRLVVNSRGDFTDHDRAELLPPVEAALHESCDYAQRLWHELDAVRAYLLESLPRGKSGGSPSPVAPRDGESWTNWMTAYASVTASLAGPDGDSGHGEQEASHEAQLRR